MYPVRSSSDNSFAAKSAVARYGTECRKAGGTQLMQNRNFDHHKILPTEEEKELSN
jgi:hypothetical protein